MVSRIIIRFICRDISSNPDSVRGDFPFERDITEIEGFDNLHHPEDILLEAQKMSQSFMEQKKVITV